MDQVCCSVEGGAYVLRKVVFKFPDPSSACDPVCEYPIATDVEDIMLPFLSRSVTCSGWIVGKQAGEPLSARGNRLRSQAQCDVAIRLQGGAIVRDGQLPISLGVTVRGGQNGCRGIAVGTAPWV